MMINQDNLVNTFVSLVTIDSPSGLEGGVANYALARLSKLGFTGSTDAAGSVFVRIAGKGSLASGDSLMFNAHMDSVPPCLGIKPQVDGDIIRSDGTTILGGDDRAGVAAILEAATHAVEGDHLPLEIVFTVQEETHLGGALALDYSKVQSKTVLTMDSHGPFGSMAVAAPFFNTFDASIHGVASHAGVAPELGISAVIAAADAIMNMPLGRIDDETTANIIILSGGTATNIIPDLCVLKGEARSLDEVKLEAQSEKMREAVRAACDKRGIHADITISREFGGYKLDESDPTVARVAKVMRSMGTEPIYERSGGASDVNIFRTHGLLAVDVSPGDYDIHTTHEYVKISDMIRASEMCLRLMQGEGIA